MSDIIEMPGTTKDDVEFVINFTLTYAPFLKAKGATDISDNEITQLVGSMVAHFETQAPINDLKEFFEVRTDEYDTEFLMRNYNVKADVVAKNTEHQFLLVKYTLTIGSKIIL